MARPITTRRPSSRRIDGPAAPAMQMATPTTPWLRNAVLCVATGIAAMAAGQLLGHLAAGRTALIASVPIAVAVGAHGKRKQLRRQLADRLLQAMAPQLGLRTLDRRAVTPTRWGWGWPGIPTQIVARYAPGLDDRDPQWQSDVLTAVTRLMLERYEIDLIDHQRCRLRLRLAGPVAEELSAPAVQVRAERTISELIGPTATIDRTEFVDGELVLIEGRHQAGAKLAAPGYRARIERILSTMLPGRWRAHWDMENDGFRFELRPSFPSSIWLPVTVRPDADAVLETYDSLAIPYGVDEDGEAMVWRPAVDPNLMLVGSPGTGKTAAAHTILTQVTGYGWPVWVVDGKSIEFLGFQSWPNVQIVGTSIEQQVAIIHRAWEVMERRYELITSGQARESDFEPLLVFLDEWADFRANLMSWYAGVKVKGDPTKPLVLIEAGSLARKGRTSRVHLVFGTQRPDAEYFGGDMRDNFRMRVSMGRLSPQGAMMMWESPTIGTSIPRGCRGRATTINDDNRAVEIQTYRTPDPRKTLPGSDEARLLDQLRPTRVVHDRLLIVPPRGELDIDTSDIDEPTYSDYATAQWVRAADRPDLDPVESRMGEHVDGRTLASPMTVFGLTDSPAAPVGRRPQLRLVNAGAVDDRPAGVTASTEEDRTFDPFEGYGFPTSMAARSLSAGDLVLIDEDEMTWGVLDEDPTEDLEDEGYLALSWRSDDDDSGVLSVPTDSSFTVRRPTELQE
ncbi:FtsK/SpoIIIE family protein [Modestobacter sp. DSM 44400]|uniref:FtsK/SpoIIIE domain-containing protein n=1 Tax=Modestobacter sp. DSM 44400 TaxID=1550230 RepID=UPI0008979757|nr:FtsK/SpoIIIE domain-containing protein [Modestobacter sp. DSM 44400]SDY85967.1 FtsK/SpoIIIE family protein [Modestobacter sp. DSM 44400]